MLVWMALLLGCGGASSTAAFEPPIDASVGGGVAGKSDVPPRRKLTMAIATAFLVRHVVSDVSAQRWLDGDQHDAAIAEKRLWDGKPVQRANRCAPATYLPAQLAPECASDEIDGVVISA